MHGVDVQYIKEHRFELIFNIFFAIVLFWLLGNMLDVSMTFLTMFPEVLSLSTDIISADHSFVTDGVLNVTQFELFTKADFILDIVLVGLLVMGVVMIATLMAAMHFVGEVIRIVAGERTLSDQILELRKEIEKWQRKD